MYISVQTGWVQFQQTAVYSFRYFGHFLKKVIEYLTEYTCTGRTSFNINAQQISDYLASLLCI